MDVAPTMGLTTKNYDILTRLAVGNGSLVYHAVDKITHRQVALKLLVQDGDVDHRFDVGTLLADSPRLRQITGAHVCQLLDAYEDDDGQVLIYEFAKGVTGSELPSQRKLDAAQMLDVAAQLISALRSGERQKCPHGDVKPSNLIFIELDDGRPFTLVLDWGLTAYRAGVMDDSLPYLAPERLAGAPASHRADLFSAGAALFFLCTGKQLVAGTNKDELQAAWEGTRPALLAEARPDLPPKFVQWLCSLLELAPEKRPESAVDALATLAALNPPPPPVPPESFRPRPVTQRTGGSGISMSPPELQTKLASAIRQPVPNPSNASAGMPTAVPVSAIQAAKTGIVPVKQSHVAMTVGLFFLLVALTSGAVWFVFFRKAEPVKYPGEIAAADPEPAAEARPPAPSVGAPIAKPFTPPPKAAQTPASVAPKPTPKPRRKKPVPVPAPAAIPPAPADSTPTPLIASDGFVVADAARAPINGLNGGSGWAGPWRDALGSFAMIDGASLVTGDFPAAGASLLIPATEREATISRALGPLERFTDPARGGTWYFSCLLQHGSELPTPGGDIQINPFNASDVHDLVRIVASNVGGALQLTLNNQPNPIEVKDTSKPVLVVMRITVKNPKLGNWDVDAELFVNPPISGTGPTPGARKIEFGLKYVLLPQQLGLLIRKPGHSEAITRIDEIRFCRSYTDIIFRPPAKK